MRDLTFIERVLMIRGIGADYISAWFTLAKCEESNDQFQIQKMIKTIVKIENDYSHLTTYHRKLRIGELSEETGLSVKVIGHALGRFGFHYRTGEFAQIFSHVFGVPLDIKEHITNTLSLYIEGVGTTLIDEAGDEVSVTIRATDGREVTFTMKAGEAILYK